MIDISSRHAYAEPLQSKDSETVGATLLSIILENKIKPRVLLTDNDAAYHGKIFQDVIDDQKQL